MQLFIFKTDYIAVLIIIHFITLIIALYKI